MSKRKVQKDRTKAPQRLLKVPPRKTTIGDLIKFGARNREQREKVARYRRDWHRFAQELAPRVSGEVARHYLKEAAFIAGIDAGRLWDLPSLQFALLVSFLIVAVAAFFSR